MNGRVQNYSNKPLWVVEFESGRPIAHMLGPNMQSPTAVDAVGFRTVDRTPIDGYIGWYRVMVATAEVRYKAGKLVPGCVFCWKVTEEEFGLVIYDYAEGWGEPL